MRQANAILRHKRFYTWGNQNQNSGICTKITENGPEEGQGSIVAEKSLERILGFHVIAGAHVIRF